MTTPQNGVLLSPPSSAETNFPVVGIGASAGGLDALRKLLENTPENTGLSFVIIQHLASGQESMLAEILSRSTKMKVQKIQNGMQIQPNQVYVIPSGKILTLQKGILKLQPKGLSLKPIDEFLRSLATDKKTQAIGIVLSGTGTDGTEGLQLVKVEGGITFAQDPKTAQYPDMPRNVIETESVYFVLPPEKMGEELTRIASHPEIVRNEIETAKQPLETKDSAQTIFGLLKASFGVNFASYKPATSNRRISRRMIINKIETPQEYVAHLKTNPKELQSLFDDLLISVTSFFRDPQTFEMLREKVFPNLFEKKQNNLPVRIWIPGCSNGEEVYSIAIQIEEYLEEKNIADLVVQIFGSDVNAKNVEKARKGQYLKIIENNVSKTQLQRFFTPINGSYQVNKQVREMCIFAKHDLTKDPQFSNLDLIICRNVLIYFDAQLQEKILPMFHYGLKPHGYLVLGQSESIGKFTYLFENIEKRGVIFQKKVGLNRVDLQLEMPTQYPIGNYPKPTSKNDPLNVLRETVDELLMTEHVPASIVLNTNLDILIFRGKVDPYLSVDSGDASFNVSKIVRKELRPTLQTAVYKSKKESKTIRETIRLVQDKKTSIIQIQVIPIETSKIAERFFLVKFEETAKCKRIAKKESQTPEDIDSQNVKDEQNKELSESLESTRQTLQAVIEQQEATNEELRSSMEEVQSSNEEMMSTNEELATAKEELQSTNEELTTLNDELKNRNLNLSILNDDLSNLMGNIDTAVVILDNELRIRRFNSSAETLLRLMPSDVGVLITDIRLGILIDGFANTLKSALNLEVIREEIKTSADHWYQMRIKPYLTEEKKTAGLVISFSDITEIKNLEDKLKVISSFTRHDVRNKLVTVNGNIYLARKLAEGQPKIQKHLDSIPDTLAKIDRIFDVSKVYENLGSHKFEIIDVGKSVKDAVSFFTDFKGAKIINEVNGFKVIADETLSTIFGNLIDNTLKYGVKTTQIRIYTEQQPDGSTNLIYEDDGEGISTEDKVRIFEKGFGKGTGLGLFLIKRCCNLYGWNITENGEHEKGARFIIEIPKDLIR
jgi:two-component system CheB/CheR fusion protein